MCQLELGDEKPVRRIALGGFTSTARLIRWACLPMVERQPHTGGASCRAHGHPWRACLSIENEKEGSFWVQHLHNGANNCR